ncbi:hypothetical protein BCR39DRAFT_544136 [Naematelia encephala]|uniref:UbiA prenyltransferase family-domain-containing protein n=1 Tax=Naematelia encephala TaxID=71784 RepID=A0A1Y2AT31_9TREE|nr:hypothetical protein BCR39DRAFT_544136 [Naematelia encephala]
MSSSMSGQDAYDPQTLTVKGTISALIALGRIPFASEVPGWALFGCLLSSQIFSTTTLSTGFLRNLDWWVTLQSMLVTWGTNVAINYGNEYFDYDLDRPGQVTAIKKDMEARQALNKSKSSNGDGTDGSQAIKGTTKVKEENAKLYANTTRIIHDGTFPPWTALACSAVWQAGLIALILSSRFTDPTLHPKANKHSNHYWRPGFGGTPFKGLGIYIGIVCTILSHSYVGPPFRLHYHGWGELVSALFLTPVALIFGMVAHYTATTGKAVSFSDIFPSSYPTRSGFTLDRQLWTLIGAVYLLQQARILVMHINDIEADIRGGKRTFVSRVGHETAKNLYALCNLVSLGLFASFAASLTSSSSSNGMFLRVGGSRLSDTSNTAFVSVWLAGLTLVLSYSIPAWSITYKALVAEIPANKELSAKSSGTTTDGLIPTVSMGNVAILVSMQTLITPVVLSVTCLAAGFVASKLS